MDKETRKQKGIIANVLDDCLDGDTSWDYVLEQVWFQRDSKTPLRETAARYFMFAAHGEVFQETDPEVALMLARFALALMGKDWEKNFLLENSIVLKRRKKEQKIHYSFLTKQGIWARILKIF